MATNLLDLRTNTLKKHQHSDSEVTGLSTRGGEDGEDQIFQSELTQNSAMARVALALAS